MKGTDFDKFDPDVKELAPFNVLCLIVAIGMVVSFGLFM
ncbi:MAG: hypothetical protein Edafosvirus2_17 [Edafosvirus sp.]|uniref:Uncharacterized protein n=1 Tax=Edafosvirus sp. TaxID=2487765 RepID=A0A3G4ZSG9_9VIRU|nr:MAG: hypothetical protein Edafosvirus2_17 [Edafosvirus sp.]